MPPKNCKNIEQKNHMIFQLIQPSKQLIKTTGEQILKTQLPYVDDVQLSRTSMFKLNLGADTAHSLTEADFRELGQRTDGYSGADINCYVAEGRYSR